MLEQPLSRDEFRSAVAKGLGRAVLHVRQYGLTGVAEEVLAACLQNVAYDPQCEERRIAWLYGLFAGSVHQADFERSILQRLQQATGTWDLSQLFGLAEVMAQSGHVTAPTVIRRRALEMARVASCHDWLGAEEFVRLEGEQAFLALAKAYGERLLNASGNEWVPEELAFEGVALDGRAVLMSPAAEDVCIQAYAAYLVRRGVMDAKAQAGGDMVTSRPLAQSVSAAPRAAANRLGVADVVELVRNSAQPHRGVLLRWGKTADQAALAELLSVIESESNPQVQARLLRAFEKVALPRFSETVLGLVNHEDADVHVAAVGALSTLCDPRLRERFRAWFGAAATEERRTTLLSLLALNFEDAFQDLVNAHMVIPVADQDAVHHRVGVLLTVCRANPHRFFSDILHQLYELSPCSLCRQHIVECLIHRGVLTDHQRKECEWDADPTVRSMVAAVR